MLQLYMYLAHVKHMISNKKKQKKKNKTIHLCMNLNV